MPESGAGAGALTGEVAWPDAIYRTLKDAGIRQIAYVPDAGHARLIELCRSDPEMSATVLTTEEEGIALLAGAWLGGEKGVLLMQSSGVGNCINMLSLTTSCGFPLPMLVTMRGEWSEFNPWQIPMGQAVGPCLSLAGVLIHTVDRADDAAPSVESAIKLAVNGQRPTAVLLSQRMIGAKSFKEER
ncbi:MAG TPA: thiamine pyrophosphate-binding protein [Alphaproteobacteria bacterium]|nr:thiamine pyrophosphate-binding protein [Alphaproteobacteria bacterium]